MNLYLIRHTTPDIDKGICYGQANIPLSDSFEEESDFLISKLKNINIQQVISSPLQRCTNLAAKIKTDFTIDDNLKELDFGDWELMDWNKIPQQEIDPWMKDFVHVPVPNGESYMDLYLRVLSVYQNIKKDKTALVTHAGVIRSILAHITKTDLTDSFDFKIPYGTIVQIDTETNQYQIL
ncbi:alpha-ribazole phosphatase [Wenyingzhuangia sp. chi5]|uniref:Alpha-ribazole phosphatase n=1 Tax=Wenyingzhuangia gilva TaxID=3057677 RepID=A0ABT8VN38_9FLAO|nr:alpha-ribazole phosphatase [Wenyingzhuangia sp. chi5]MDO3693367.1 alpha-ribazole phosphatase [Wenyingzhuangia sp. chi5]